MKYSLAYYYLVVKKDIPKLPLCWKEKIKQSIEKRLTTQPELYGKSLRKSLKGYRKLRVGDYRVVFRIESRTVKIFVIAHRLLVYHTTEKRTDI